MRSIAARIFLRFLLPLIVIVVLVNAIASITPVFYPRRLFVELCVLASVIPAFILHRARQDILAMYIALSMIATALSYGVLNNGGIFSPAYVALMISVVYVHIIAPLWGTLVYYGYIVVLGAIAISYTPPIELGSLPSATYYWVMYSTYGALLVTAQVVISKLFNRLLEQNIERETQLDSAINTISDPLMITNTQGEMTHLNTQGELLKKELEDSYGLTLFEVPLEMAEMAEFEETTTLSALCATMLTKQRERESATYEQLRCEVRLALRGVHRWYMITIDHYGEDQGLVIHARDNTAQHKIIQAQKMNAVGQLAGGIAHEFNNMLSAITGSVDLLKLDSRDDQAELIELIEEGALRASRITKQLLMFTQRRPQFQTVIDLHRLLESAMTLLEGSLDKKLSLLLVQGATRSCIRGDDRLLISTIMNLAMNASEAMSDGGVIILKTSDLSPILRDRSELWTHPLDPMRSYLSLEVIDQGIGIANEVLGRIFEPFYTTHSSGGEGIGLTAVYGAVNKHHGGIRVTSKLGEGSTFQLAFPLTEETINLAREESVAEGDLPERLRVLLVDDEAIVQQTMSNLLRGFGCEVTTANNGLEGVKYFQEGTFDLIILDVMMPLLDGIQALKLIQEHRAAVPVVIHSGYASDDQLEELSKLGVSRILSKPASRSDVLRAILTALPKR